MKARPVIIGILLAAVLGLAWHNHRQLAGLRDYRAKLLARAAAQGITIESENPGTLALPAKFPRVDRVAEAKRIATDFMAFGDDFKGLERDSDPDALDEAARQRINAQMDRVAALDGEQLKILIAEIYSASGGTYEYRDLICYALHRLAEDHPGDALEILTKTPGMFELVRYNGIRAEILISEGLPRLAARDPEAALKWYHENRDSLAPDEQEGAGNALVKAAAAKDPRLALKLMDECGLNPVYLLPTILPRSTPEQRTASLAVLREWHGGKAGPPPGEEEDFPPPPENPFKTALQSLAFSHRDGPDEGRASFKDSAAWIDQAKLSPEELKLVVDNLHNSIHPEESGRWVEWLERNLPLPVARDETDSIFRDWVRSDPGAAGRWLEAAPAGPVQESAVLAYVRIMAGVDPEKAIGHALTLPEGKARKEAFWEIHAGWPRKNEDEAAKAAAAAFAKEHGIK